jgi:hypothetical protein
MAHCAARKNERPALSLTPNSALRLFGLLAAVLLLAACSSPGSQTDVAATQALPDDGVRRDPVVAGRRARVFVMAGFGENCESLPAPEISVTRQPAKGTVTFEPGQSTTIKTSATGTCIGKDVQGTGIYYTARPGEQGADNFAIEASLGGSTTQRSFTVDIVD